MLRVEKEAEIQLQHRLREQQSQFEQHLERMVHEKVMSLLGSSTPSIPPPTMPLDENGAGSMLPDLVHFEPHSLSQAVAANTSASVPPFGVSSSGDALATTSSFGTGGDSISGTTVRAARGEVASVGFTFGSGIAPVPASPWTIHSNLPFALSTPGPTFQSPMASRRATPAPDCAAKVAKPHDNLEGDNQDIAQDTEK